MTNGAATPATANNSIFDEIADTTARQQNTVSARASRCEGFSKRLWLFGLWISVVRSVRTVHNDEA